MYEVALFDFDGVIVNSEQIRFQTYRKLFFNEYGINLDINFDKMVGKPEDANLKTFLINNNLPKSDSIISKLKLKRKNILLEEARKGFPAINNILAIIGSLQKHQAIKLGIVTNSTKEYVLASLNSLGLDENIFFIVTKDDVKRAKPFPDIYLKALGMCEQSKESILVFEDSKVGLEAAHKAEMKTVAVLSSFSKEMLKSEYYLEVEDSMNEVKKILKLFGI